MKILSSGPKGSFFVTVLMPDNSVKYSKEYQLGDLNVYRYPDEGKVIFVEAGDAPDWINKEAYTDITNGDTLQPFSSFDELDAWISDNMFLSPGSGGNGGGGTGGTVDVTNLATKQNQVTQITRETEIRDNLISLLAKVAANPATSDGQASELTALSNILSKLSNDPASQTTLAAILAKLISNPATADNQASEISALNSIASKDFATQTTLAALLTKLSDPASQTTLAAILAKLTADPSTGAKQDTGNTSLASIDTKLTKGQSTKAQSIPVVLASNSDPVPILEEVRTETDFSGSITAGGVAQVAQAAVTAGRFVRIINRSNETLWFSTTGTAGVDLPGSFALGGSPVYLGGSFETQKKITNAISVYGANTGSKYTLINF